VVTSGSSTRDTIAVALGGSVDPSHAPVPRSPAERLLFRHLYQTLIRVDCHGAVEPSLAESWGVHQDARLWSFTLRADAAFWDGTPVTAEAVKQSWLVAQGSRVAPWHESVASAVQVVGERQLEVRLRRAYQDVPRVFADPTLAVARGMDSSGAWPLGTGAYQIVESSAAEIHAVPLGSMSGDALPVLRFFDAGDDPRDAVDLGADLLVSSEPIVVDYIETFEDLESLPHAWDMAYVVAAPLKTASGVSTREGPPLMEVLGSETVRTESRMPVGELWWEDLSACQLTSTWSVPADPGNTAGRIVYRRGDPVARELAQRLVALAEPDGLPQIAAEREPLTAVGLGDERFDRALADGRDLGFVVALPKQVLDPCAMIALMRRSMPWVAPSDLHRVLVPLLETRGRVIVRRGVGTMVRDWDGAPLLSVTLGH
jgi:hypothetical protein